MRCRIGTQFELYVKSHAHHGALMLLTLSQSAQYRHSIQCQESPHRARIVTTIFLLYRMFSHFRPTEFHFQLKKRENLHPETARKNNLGYPKITKSRSSEMTFKRRKQVQRPSEELPLEQSEPLAFPILS